ncbi:rodlin [Streptomyces sp. H51]|uniref:rodlin n=1 Tax=Streptomyces sp. H51 TaxID=3111770 RepID=UPI002D781C99|nr:rodlin [Streptomyces sp. H51]
MLKKAMVAAAAAASVIGMSVAAAPTALAAGDDSGPTVANGNGASSSFGNSVTKGDRSPQLSFIGGSFNKPCAALNDIDVATAGPGPATVLQDVSLLSDDLNQQCADNSTQAKRDGALSHVLEDMAVLSAVRG